MTLTISNTSITNLQDTEGETSVSLIWDKHEGYGVQIIYTPNDENGLSNVTWRKMYHPNIKTALSLYQRKVKKMILERVK